jgi:hypothetical protein
MVLAMLISWAGESIDTTNLTYPHSQLAGMGDYLIVVCDRSVFAQEPNPATSCIATTVPISPADRLC